VNRTLLATAFVLALAGSGLAIAHATDNGPPAREIAPAPHLKSGLLNLAAAPPPRLKPAASGLETAPRPHGAGGYTAPKFPDSFEVLVFAELRPVRIRASILQNGKSVGELWRDRLRRSFDYCDRDGDGYLNTKEIAYVFSDQGMSQLLSNGFYQPSSSAPPTLAFMDKDGDNLVSFDEFVAYYRLSSSQVLRAQPLQPDVNDSAAVTEAIFKLLDANGDGKLTRDEVAAFEKLIATRDADEDECLSVEELLPHLYEPVFGGRRVVPVVPPSSAAGSPVSPVRQMVVVYESGRIPGTITQQIIQKYDKDGDFELTRQEIGFDEETFRKFDKDGNGKLDGEELDLWRTGDPDLTLSLSMGPRTADCVVKLGDEKVASARGFKLNQLESGRLVLHVGRQPIDFRTFAAASQSVQQPLKVQYGYLFTQSAGAKNYIDEKDISGEKAVQFQFVRVIFDAADRDGDGKLTRAEFDAYFDLQDSFRSISLSLTPAVTTPSLFQLLDDNRDGRLSVRELRTAWTRLVVLEQPGAQIVTRNIIQPSVTLRLSRSFERFFINQGLAINFNQQNQVPIPQKGPLWFRKMDRNGDGDVSRTEFIGTREEFAAIDADGDGLISLDEAEVWDKKSREKPPQKTPEVIPGTKAKP
jgi:Ca2+-binding EF-hand superfamily protein